MEFLASPITLLVVIVVSYFIAKAILRNIAKTKIGKEFNDATYLYVRGQVAEVNKSVIESAIENAEEYAKLEARMAKLGFTNVHDLFDNMAGNVKPTTDAKTDADTTVKP